MDIATLGVASAISLENGSRVCRQARIALGAVAPTPIRAIAAEDVLLGKELTSELIQQAAREAQKAAHPIDDIRGSAEHRRAIVGVLTQRTLETALEMALDVEGTFERLRDLALQQAF